MHGARGDAGRGSAGMIGLYGKMPAHGDFIRRNLPDGFVVPWDLWLQDALAFLKDSLGDDLEEAWERAPAWRFRLSAGTCGEAAAQGVLMPSCDWVGRLFPLTIARLAPPGEAVMPAEWHEEVAARLAEGLAAGWRADDLMAALLPLDDRSAWPDEGPAPEGWWCRASGGPVATGLPAPPDFLAMVAGPP
jgi:type VI secretion system protein ImpM